MNKIEHLLACLAEECAEVQQAATKALRFGLIEGCPDTDRTNSEDIVIELCDLLAVVEMLVDEGAIREPVDKQAINLKKDRVIKYMGYAEKRGALTL